MCADFYKQISFLMVKSGYVKTSVRKIKTDRRFLKVLLG